MTRIDSRQVLAVCLAVSVWVLLDRYAEPVADAFVGFCVGYTASDIGRMFVRRHTKERA